MLSTISASDHSSMRPPTTGRQRPWQAVSQGLDWGQPEEAGPGSADPEDRIAAEALTDLLVEREVQRLRAAQASRDTEPAAWQEVTGLLSSMLWLTAEEAADLRRRLTDLLQSPNELSAERAAHPDTRPEDARLVSLVGWLVPAGPQRERETGARP